MADSRESKSIADTDQFFAGAGAARGKPRLRIDRSPALASAEEFSIRDSIQVLRVPGWEKLKWLQHGFSSRGGGSSTIYSTGELAGELNLGFTRDDHADHVSENRRIFLAAVTGEKKLRPQKRGQKERSDLLSPRRLVPELVVLRQIHSSLIRRVGSNGDSLNPVALAAGDGLMTSEPGVMLGVLTADCIPILIADRKKRAVAAFHAGWRGTLKRIVEAGAGRMRVEFGSKPEDLVAAIGPGIGSCCYAIGEEVQQQFESQFAYASKLFSEVSDSDAVRHKYPMLFMTARAPGHSDLGPSVHLDLGEANRRQLLDAGLKPKRISMLNQCTSCNPQRFFSHRRQQGFTGRMMAVIGVKK